MTEMLAMEVRRLGGPDALTPVRRAIPEPGSGEVLLRQEAIGVNFVDLNHRSGEPFPISVPFVPGIEAVGTVVAVGDRMVHDYIGRRMAYAGPMPGAYATHAVIDHDFLFPVPDGITPDVAAAVTMQAMTASYLVTDVFPVSQGDVVVVHAAAGGVGGYLVQMAKSAGAVVVGTSRRADKASIIRQAGADHVIVLDAPDDLARVADLVGPCSVIFDG
ncbi:MAG: zinc-binding dehydrogenase, partial [Hyphomonas sp.]|nr:zinc-binding dehydrogenase [Hyphomonas sp.]